MFGSFKFYILGICIPSFRMTHSYSFISFFKLIAQIQIKMPFFCNYFRWMGGSIEFFMLIILTKVIFAKNRLLYPKNRFFEKIDPKGRLKYSSRDGGTKIFFVGYESSRPVLTVDEKWRRFRDYRTRNRLRKFDSKIQKISRM